MLGIDDIIAYALALGIAAVIPGPGMTALVARSVGSGAIAGFAMLFGLILGDLAYLSFAVFGLSIIAQNFHAVFTLVRIFSILFLLYLAWQFWRAEHQDMNQPVVRGKDLLSSIVSGLAITLGNPKTIAFYMAILPLVIDMQQVGFDVWATTLVPVTVLVLIVAGGIYVLGAVAVRHWLSGARAQRRLHRGASIAMAGAAGSLIFKG